MDLQGKTAMVTGAARGIGRSVALELARRGAQLIVNDLAWSDAAAEVMQAIESAGGSAIFAAANIGDVAAVDAMFTESLHRYGRIDILVNNAAVSVRKPFLEMTVDEASATWDVVQRGAFLCSQHAARQMVQQGTGGNIVMVSSVHAERPYPNAIAYNAAKAALNHMAASMALELAGHGIRVNSLEPGWIDTPGERRHNTEQEIVERGRTLPMKRLGTPEEIAKAVAFLCSEDASYITGATLRVDGGFALRF